MLTSSGTTTLRRKAANLASPPPLPPPQLRIPARRSGASTGKIGLQLPRYLASPRGGDEDIPATKKPRLDPSIKSAVPAVLTNDVADLCSESDDEKPKPQDSTSSMNTDAFVDTVTSLLGKKRKGTPIPTATAEADTKTA
jgi:hypothetical protein